MFRIRIYKYVLGVLCFLAGLNVSSFSLAAESRSIDLKEAIETMIKNNWSLKNLYLQEDISKTKVQGVKEAYLPFLSSQFKYSDYETGASAFSPIPSSNMNAKSWETAVSKLFVNGLTFTVTGSVTDTKASLSGATALEDGRKNAKMFLSYPLIKNRGGRSLKYPLEIALFDIDRAGFEEQYGLEAAMLQTIAAFYTVCHLLEEKKAVNENLAGAKSVLETMKHRSDIGTAEAKHYLLSQAAYEFQRLKLIDLEKQLKQSKSRLLMLMGYKEINMEYEVVYSLKEKGSLLSQEFDLKNGQSIYLTKALAQRKDLQLIDIDLKKIEKNLKLQMDEVSPELNLDASYGSDGLNASNTFSVQETPGWFVGFSFKKSWGGISKIAEIRKQIEQIGNTRAELELKINEEVIAEIKEVEAVVSSLKRSEQLLEIQTKRLAEEEKDFNLGRTSVKDLTEARDDVTSAKLTKVNFEINLIVAYAKLLFVLGELNKEQAIKL